MIEVDWEYSESDCPKCQSQMAIRRCGDCGGEGYLEDDDDEWRGDERCDNCRGKGFEEWCRECGWDAVEKRFLSPEYERAFIAKVVNDAIDNDLAFRELDNLIR